MTDITYIRTWQGWLYLAVVMGLFARKVVGWSMATRLRSALVCDALQMALWQRRPPKGQLVHHSDRGVQYASKVFRKLLNAHGIEGSMSRKGDCWDNAVTESFFARLKTELIQRQSWASQRAVKDAVADYIEGWYNPYRLHSSLGYVSPMQFESNYRLNGAQAA